MDWHRWRHDLAPESRFYVFDGITTCRANNDLRLKSRFDVVGGDIWCSSRDLTFKWWFAPTVATLTFCVVIWTSSASWLDSVVVSISRGTGVHHFWKKLKKCFFKGKHYSTWVEPGEWCDRTERGKRWRPRYAMLSYMTNAIIMNKWDRQTCKKRIFRFKHWWIVSELLPVLQETGGLSR